MTILSRNLGLFKLRVDNELNREQKCLTGVHQLQMSLPSYILASCALVQLAVLDSNSIFLKQMNLSFIPDKCFRLTLC